MNGTSKYIILKNMVVMALVVALVVALVGAAAAQATVIRMVQ